MRLTIERLTWHINRNFSLSCRQIQIIHTNFIDVAHSCELQKQYTYRLDFLRAMAQFQFPNASEGKRGKQEDDV